MPAIQNNVNLYVNANGQLVNGSEPLNYLYRNNLSRNIFYIITPLSQAAVCKLIFKNTALSNQGYTQNALLTGYLGDSITSKEASYYELVKDWNVFKCIPSGKILTKFPSTVNGSISVTVSIKEPDLSDSSTYTFVKAITTNDTTTINALTPNQYVKSISAKIVTNYGTLNYGDSLVNLAGTFTILRALWLRSTTEPLEFLGNPSLEDNDFNDADVGEPTLLDSIIATQNEQTVELLGVNTNINDLDTRVTDTENVNSSQGTDINALQKEVAALESSISTGENYIGTLSGATLPTNTELNTFVANNTTPSRAPKRGDTVIFVQKIASATDKNFKYIFSDKWSSYEIPPVEDAQNGSKGILMGTYGTYSGNNVLFDIVNGEIKNVYVNTTPSATVPTYQKLENVTSSLLTNITNILNGTQKVCLAKQSISDQLGNVINTYYMSISEGATKDFVRNYAQPKAAFDIYYVLTNSYADDAPTTTDAEFIKSNSASGRTLLFSPKRTLTTELLLTKKNITTNTFWFMTDKTVRLTFEVVTKCKAKDDTTYTIAQSYTTDEQVFTANTIKKVEISSPLSQLLVEKNLDIGGEFTQDIYVVRADATAINISFYSNTTYSSEFYFTNNAITYDVNYVNSPRQVNVLSSDFVLQEDGSYKATVSETTHKQANIKKAHIDYYILSGGEADSTFAGHTIVNNEIVLTATSPVDLELEIFGAVSDAITKIDRTILNDLVGINVNGTSDIKEIDTPLDSGLEATINSGKATFRIQPSELAKSQLDAFSSRLASSVYIEPTKLAPVWCDNYLYSGSSYVYADRDSKAVVVSGIGGVDTQYTLKAYIDFGNNLALGDGEIVVSFRDKISGNILVDDNGNEIKASKTYVTGDNLGYITLGAVKTFNISTEVELYVYNPIDDLLELNSHTSISIQALERDKKVSASDLAFDYNNSLKWALEYLYCFDDLIHTKWLSSARDISETSLSDKVYRYNDGLIVEVNGGLKYSLTSGALKFINDDTNMLSFDFGTVLSTLETEAFKGKTLNISCKIKNASSFNIVLLKKATAYKGEKILTGFTNGVKQYASGWSEVQSLFIAENLSDYDFSGTLTVPSDTTYQFAILLIPNGAMTPNSVTISNYDVSITNGFIYTTLKEEL